MLLPKKVAHRKVRIGKNRGNATRCNYVAFGDYGKIWIRIFPHTPVTKKALGLKMGGGKGNPEYYVAKVKTGTVMFEMKGVSEEIAREAMRLAGHKLPVRVRFVKKEEA